MIWDNYKAAFQTININHGHKKARISSGLKQGFTSISEI
ncbi:hypothetical protein VSVS12_01623 [Vibrio scophthalmi]|uniref:Uncharacterized protein n=1 Tax=Vibrio scophthalmi TaxID=45658 RepID=A0A1B1NNT1_9VIBR|nr:hypothetical protein VSVS12_01623 [Vibrio scophthalmi]ANU36373.1 hypothetical protein VSVS05_01246 [Vibrio scophthalmi]